MKSGLLFYEKQQFRQWWLWLLLAVINIIVLYPLILNSGTVEMPALAGETILLLVTFWLWRLALVTKIDRKGIYVKFESFHRDFKFYDWESIDYCEIKKYNPIMDYGGWGIRIGAYNVSGNTGLLIYFKDGTKLMLGTNKEDELFAALSQIESKNPSMN